jgi:tetratricopeptide (TPR) repeat protein
VIVTILLFASTVGAFAMQQQRREINALLTAGNNLLQSNRSDDAIVLMSDALRKDSNCAQAHYYRGIAYAQSGQYDKAETDFQSSLAEGASASMVALAQAVVETNRHNWKQALMRCNQAKAAGNESADLYRVRANCFAHLNDFPHMAEDYDKALMR